MLLPGASQPGGAVIRISLKRPLARPAAAPTLRYGLPSTVQAARVPPLASDPLDALYRGSEGCLWLAGGSEGRAALP